MSPVAEKQAKSIWGNGNLHCKIDTIRYFLSMQGIEIDTRLLFLLGMEEFLEFGVERYRGHLLWFMVPYSYDSEKQIMKKLNIVKDKLEIDSIQELHEMIDDKRAVCVYFDNLIRQRYKQKVFNHVGAEELDVGKVRNSSFGMIVGYNDKGWILNIVDLDNKNIVIRYDKFYELNLKNNLCILSISDSDSERLANGDLWPLVLQSLQTACDNYMKDSFKYEYDPMTDKYGTVGRSAFLALNEEVGTMIRQYMESTDSHYKNSLIYMLNILRIYQTKGSETCFRKEIGDSLRALNGLRPGIDLNSITDQFENLGKLWRNLNRLIFNVNSPYYSRFLNVFQNKLSDLLDKLYIQEGACIEEFGKQLNQIVNFWDKPR